MKGYAFLLFLLILICPVSLFSQIEKEASLNSLSVIISPDWNLYTIPSNIPLGYNSEPTIGYRFKIDIQRVIRKQFELKMGICYGRLTTKLKGEAVIPEPITISQRYRFAAFSIGAKYFWRQRFYNNLEAALALLNQLGTNYNDLSVAPLVSCGVGWQKPYKKVLIFIQPTLRYMFQSHDLRSFGLARYFPSLGFGIECGLRFSIHKHKLSLFKPIFRV